MSLPTPTYQLGGDLAWSRKKEKLLASSPIDKSSGGILHRPKPITTSRSSVGWTINRDQVWIPNESELGRISFENYSDGAYLNEPGRTNLILSDPLMVGGTSGSPGIQPTGYGFSNFGGGTIIISDGSINGGKKVRFQANEERTYFSTTLNVVAGNTYIFSSYVDITTTNQIRQLVSRTTGGLSMSVSYHLNGIEVEPSYYPSVGRHRLGIKLYDLTPSGTLSFRFGVGCSGVTTGDVTFELPQIELGEYSTSLIPESNTTRVEDTMGIELEPALIGQTEGSLFIRGTVLDPTAGNYISLSDGTGDNRIQIGFALTSGNLTYTIRCGGSSEVSQSMVGNYTANTDYRIAVRYTNNDCVLYLNGAKILTDTVANISFSSQLNTLNLGDNNLSNNSATWKGCVREIKVWSTPLTDAQLEKITT